MLRDQVADLKRRLAAAEELLREREARHHLLSESWGQAVWETDALGVVTADSPSWRAYTGQKLEEWLGYGWLDAIHPDDRAYAERQWRAAIAACEIVDAEFRLRSPDGDWRWTNVRAAPVTDANGDIEKWAGLNIDIDDRKRAEEALRASEERQTFLLALSDATRQVSDPLDAQRAASRLLRARLGADRVAYAELDADEDTAHLLAEDHAADLPSFEGQSYSWSQFDPSGLAQAKLGRSVVRADIATANDLSSEQRAQCAAVGFRSLINVPLVKDGRLVAFIAVHFRAPHLSSPADIALVEDTAERTWAAVQRARAEASLKASEERFRQFAHASAAGLWIRDAEQLRMEFVSPSIGTIYGVDPEALLGDVKHWAAMIVPEDRNAALAHLELARTGEIAVHEFRIRRWSDGTFRWIRNTDFPLKDDVRVARVGGIAEDITETRQLAEHRSMLLAELQHRVRNIMAIIRSMVRRSADGATDVEDFRSLLDGRLMAFARVQVLLTREANAGGWLRGILEDEIGAQAHHYGQFELAGPNIRLSPKAVEVLTLAFHELTTNALKYGALSVPEGRLRVEWVSFEKRGRTWLALDWREEGAPPGGPVTRRGFGSDLIEGRVPYELAGTGRIVIEPGGAHCHLEFPLQEGESVLETDAPAASTVFGGTLDMAGAPDLTGRVVLVVEDDYYIAGDTAAALRGAGATVLGPCPSVDATLDLLQTEMPTHAVLDLNLGGGGPRFEIAYALKSRSVPFVFLTGYDPDVIPADMADVCRLQKPVAFRTIVDAVANL